MSRLNDTSSGKLNVLTVLIYLLFSMITFSASAQCVEGDCQNGWGLYKFSNGFYKGEFKNGKKNGYGMYLWLKDGWNHIKHENFENNIKQSYVGGWLDDEKHGAGYMSFKSSGDIQLAKYYKGELMGDSFYFLYSSNSCVLSVYYLGQKRSEQRYINCLEYFIEITKERDAALERVNMHF